MIAIRKQIHIDAAPRAVWRALTTTDGALAWWADEVRIDAREGGRIVLTYGEGEEAISLRGVFHKVQPTRAIEIKWDSTGSAPARGARLQFRIGRGDGETRLHIVLSGGEGLSDDEEAWQAASDDWETRLKVLRSGLED
jgi:uncharacterized protein YndB with AHSA1/START domain